MKKFKKYWRITSKITKNSTISIEYEHEPTDKEIELFISDDKIKSINIEIFYKIYSD